MTVNFQRLRNFTTSLSLSVEKDLAEMEQILDGDGELPKGCPSKEAMAGLVLRHVEKYLVEVNSAVTDIKKELREKQEGDSSCRN